MAESGGATRIQPRSSRCSGENRVQLGDQFVAFIVGIRSFFQVGFVLADSLVFTIARRTGLSLVRSAFRW